MIRLIIKSKVEDHLNAEFSYKSMEFGEAVTKQKITFSNTTNQRSNQNRHKIIYIYQIRKSQLKH